MTIENKFRKEFKELLEKYNVKVYIKISEKYGCEFNGYHFERKPVGFRFTGWYFDFRHGSTDNILSEVSSSNLSSLDIRI